MKIAVASGKGGTGKTTLSVNLASYLAEKTECVLADLDVEEPNSGLFLDGVPVKKLDRYKMTPEWKEEVCSGCGVCSNVCNFHALIKLGQKIMVFPELCHGCYACSELCPNNALPMKQKKMGELREFSSGSLKFVESRLLIGEEQAVPLIRQTVEYLKETFTRETPMILDSPPGTSCPVIEAVKDADFVILVTEPTPFGLNDLRLAVETVRQLQKPFGVVINRDRKGAEPLEQYCTTELIDIIARIPDDRKIAEIYSGGGLLYRRIPSVAAALEDIEAYLSGMEGVSL